MRHRLLSVGLIATFALIGLPTFARQDDDHRNGRGKREEHEDRKSWKDQEKSERKYWKEVDKGERKHDRHRYEVKEGHHHHSAPAWMSGYWRADEQRRYVALVPGDPSRIYVFLDGRWVLRQIRDPRARLDLEGAFQLPMAPPPVAPPRLGLGLDLHVVLFN